MGQLVSFSKGKEVRNQSERNSPTPVARLLLDSRSCLRFPIARGQSRLGSAAAVAASARVRRQDFLISRATQRAGEGGPVACCRSLVVRRPRTVVHPLLPSLLSPSLFTCVSAIRPSFGAVLKRAESGPAEKRAACPSPIPTRLDHLSPELVVVRGERADGSSRPTRLTCAVVREGQV